MPHAPRLQPKMPTAGPWRAQFQPFSTTVEKKSGQPITGSIEVDERELCPTKGTIVDIGSYLNGAEQLAIVTAHSDNRRHFAFTTAGSTLNL